MITVKEYIAPQNVTEAYELFSTKKSSTILGGGAFIRMGSKNIGTLIDLSKAKIDYINETESTFEIGAMATFGDIEHSKILAKHFDNLLAKSVREIVGLQLRNLVTVGGTVYSRYGFSDFLTGLLALDTEVNFHKQGRISLEEYLEEGPKEKDILESITVPKDGRRASYITMRNSKGDYAILNVAVSKLGDDFRIAVGARPQRAILAKKAMGYLSSNGYTEEHIKKTVEIAAEEITFGTNTRGSKEYRKQICKALLKKALMEVVSYED